MNVKTRVTAFRIRSAAARVLGTIAFGAAAVLSNSCASSVAPTGNTTVATPALLAPANGALIANTKQPVTLTINNAFVTESSATVLYTFEVALDAAFSSKVQTPTASPGSNGQTSVVLSTLAPGLTYYWHARATGGSTVGTFSAAMNFAVGPALSLTAPTVVAPLSGATPSGFPTFTVTDSLRTGPITQVTYRFDVSTTSTFTSILLTATVPETGGQTSFTPPISTPVPAGAVLFWRATAVDTPDGVTSAASPAQSFTPQALTEQAILAFELGQTLWPGAQPTGTNGQAVLGNGCSGAPNWGIATCFSPVSQVTFVAPTIEALRYFDLFDRGVAPPDAINWLNANGYPTAAEWYPPPEKAVLGLGFFYLAARNQVVGFGTVWDIVIGLGPPLPFVAWQMPR